MAISFGFIIRYFARPKASPGLIPVNLESEKTILLTIGLSENVTELSKTGLNNQINSSNKGIKTDQLHEGNLQLSLPFNKSGKTKG